MEIVNGCSGLDRWSRRGMRPRTWKSHSRVCN